MQNRTLITVFFVLLLINIGWQREVCAQILQNEKFTNQDAVLVVDVGGDILYQWQANNPMTPASLVKLVTAELAIEKWGLAHQFKTEFYVLGKQLWVKGYGDPYLISEEIDIIAQKLGSPLVNGFESINVDVSYFKQEPLPGGSMVSDPYNAPLSAVAANFNTVKLIRKSGQLLSAERQTPLTQAAKLVGLEVGGKPKRVNLLNAQLAQQHFAQILLAKLGKPGLTVFVDKITPESARLVYTHYNSHTLADMLKGALRYSNNFVTNQLFLLLGEGSLGEKKSLTGHNASMRFSKSRVYSQKKLTTLFSWKKSSIVDGSGLSRDNIVTAFQLLDILQALAPHKHLLKTYPIQLVSAKGVAPSAQAYAKTGTMSGIHNFAGLLEIDAERYYFVFMSNRAVVAGFRESLLNRLAVQLASAGSDAHGVEPLNLDNPISSSNVSTRLKQNATN